MAKFNEILKAKREELHLSIADVSERTRLTERYIIALEERDIHAFEDDLSYLRYFVRAYCDAVGVPFEEVRQDIQEALDEYGQEKEMAMTAYSAGRCAEPCGSDKKRQKEEKT